MKRALDQFEENVSRIRDLDNLTESISKLITPAIDISDILRAEIVLAVSALDHFVHELVRLAMLEIAAGTRPPTDAFEKFTISIKDVKIGASTHPSLTWFENVIREKHSWLSFQHPEKVADALRLIANQPLWDSVATQINRRRKKTLLTAKDIKITLRLIVDRRDKIAHEADMDPTAPGTRWAIDHQDVLETMTFVQTIARAIYKVAR